MVMMTRAMTPGDKIERRLKTWVFEGVGHVPDQVERLAGFKLQATFRAYQHRLASDQADDFFMAGAGIENPAALARFEAAKD
jgi:hypothetical protein